MANSITIRYAPRPDASPECQLEALVACYSFLIERAEERKAAEAPTVSEPAARRGMVGGDGAAEEGGERGRDLNQR